jgi:hypothetical protein
MKAYEARRPQEGLLTDEAPRGALGLRRRAEHRRPLVSNARNISPLRALLFGKACHSPSCPRQNLIRTEKSAIPFRD